MLVATPGQTEAFTLHSSAKAQLPITNTELKPAAFSTSTATKADNNRNSSAKSINHTITGRSHINSYKVSDLTKTSTTTNTSTANTADIRTSALMKSLSGRFNRGTEFIKETVQKVFNVTISNPPNTNNTSSSTTSTNINSLNKCNDSNLNETTAKTVTSSSTDATTTSVNKVLKNVDTSITDTSTTKDYTLPPSDLHRQVEKYRTDDFNSIDSFHGEMCHFRPIRLEPVTPWKSGSNIPRRGVIIVPKTILNSSIKIEFNFETNGWKNLESSETVSHIHMNKNNNLNIFSPSHKSAFVKLVKVVEENSSNVIDNTVNKKRTRSCKALSTTTKQTTEKEEKVTRTGTKRRKINTTANSKHLEKKAKITEQTKSKNKVINKNNNNNNKSRTPKVKNNNNIKINNNNSRKYMKVDKPKKQQKPTVSPPLTRSRARTLCKTDLKALEYYNGRHI